MMVSSPHIDERRAAEREDRILLRRHRQEIDLVGAEMKGTESHLTLRIVSELISRDPQFVGRGRRWRSGNRGRGQKDVWTFARDTRTSDPNWKLVATEAED